MSTAVAGNWLSKILVGMVQDYYQVTGSREAAHPEVLLRAQWEQSVINLTIASDGECSITALPLNPEPGSNPRDRNTYLFNDSQAVFINDTSVGLLTLRWGEQFERLLRKCYTLPKSSIEVDPPLLPLRDGMQLAVIAAQQLSCFGSVSITIERTVITIDNIRFGTQRDWLRSGKGGLARKSDQILTV